MASDRTGSNADPDSNGESAAASTGHHGARADGGVGANIGVLAARAPSVAAGGLDDEGRAGVSFGVRVGLAGGKGGNGDGDVDGDRHDCARRTETNETWRRLRPAGTPAAETPAKAAVEDAAMAVAVPAAVPTRAPLHLRLPCAGTIAASAAAMPSMARAGVAAALHGNHTEDS